MANTTVRGAKSIHGANPQTLVEQVIRQRIYDSAYWKEECFALTAVSLIDKAIKINAVGGTYDNGKPTQFISLLLKLLQIQPEKEIIVEYLLVEEFKYLRALAAMYIRMTFRAVEVYQLLEPLLNDYRKLRLLSMNGYSLTYIDEFVDQLLTEERVCDIILPRLPKRTVLEETEGLEARKSSLLDAMEDKGSESGSSRGKERGRSRASTESRSKSRSHSPSYISEGDNEDRYISRTPSRSRSRSPEKMDTT